MQSPYIQNCTNFIPNSIGLKIDGNHSIGPTKSMVVDSYTQYNQGGIGVSITNEGYAQLVSIFTICDDIAIFCGSGSACDLTNSNSSFGNFGLVSDGVGPKKYTGIITTASAADSDTFVLDLNVPTLNVSKATYDNVVGIITITTTTDHNFNVGMGVTISELKFNCPSVNGVTNYNISTANYTNTTGILTVTTSTNHNFSVGISVTMSNMVFSCDSGSGVSTAFFPPAINDNNGDPNHIFNVISIPSSNEFVVNVGISTITHSYVEGGVVSISTIANFPSGNFGYIFEVNAIGSGDHQFVSAAAGGITRGTGTGSVFVGVATASGTIGITTTFITGITTSGIINGQTLNTIAGVIGAGTTVTSIGIQTVFINPPSLNTGVLVAQSVGFGSTTPLPVVSGIITASTASYIPVTGVLTVNTTVNHGLTSGNTVTFAADIFTFTCSLDNYTTNHLYPRITDPAYNVPLTVSVIDGDSFTVNVGISSANSFSAYVGVSTLAHTYVSGGTVKTNVTRPFDGQVVFLDELYFTVGSVTVGSGGTGYTGNVDITFDAPSEPWGVPATAVGEVRNGSVTSVEMISNGRGYTGIPTATFASPNSGINTATGTANLVPTYYSILSSTPISAGICTIVVNDNLPYAVGLGSTVPFFKQSRVLASGHSLEYIGSGTNINGALPNQGGVAIQENEVDMRNGGLVVFTSTDQSGNFRIGDGVVINQQTGTISGTFYSKSLFSTMTPFILALGGD
jgi:hypothetical protein